MIAQMADSSSRIGHTISHYRVLEKLVSYTLARNV